MAINKLTIDSVKIGQRNYLYTECSITLDGGQSFKYVSKTEMNIGATARFEDLGCEDPRGTTYGEARDALGEDYEDIVTEALIAEAKKKYFSFAAMIVSATEVDPAQSLQMLGDIVDSAVRPILSDIEAVAHRLELYDVEPDSEFTAAAGRDFGQVRAYKMGGWYLIKYGDNGQTNYATDNRIDDLAVWLIPDDLYGVDLAICIANVRGIDAVVAAEDDYDDTYKILRTRDYYGPISRTDLIDEDFDDYAAAQAWVESAEDGIYVTGHNEVGRPTYTIISD